MIFLDSGLSAAADTALLFADIILLSFISGTKTVSMRAAVVLSAAAAVGFSSEMFFYKINYPIQFLVLLIDIFGCCLAAMYAVKARGIKCFLAPIIFQFMCSTLAAGLYSLFPVEFSIGSSSTRKAIMLMIVVLAIVFLMIIKRKTKNRRIVVSEAFSIIPVHTYILILMAVFIGSGLIDILKYETPNLELKNSISTLLLILLIICVFSLIISLIANVVGKRYYGNINRILKAQINSQLRHYEQREKVNSEMRRFKHDYNNHIKCLDSMLAAQRYDDAKEYLDKLTKSVPSSEFLFSTGNYIADAILTEKQEAILKDNVRIDFSGFIPSNIDNFDLCTILSNSLDNAAEACEQLSGEKAISVYANVQQTVFLLIVKNPTIDTCYAKDILPMTTKSDKLYHGFGLSNIQYVVGKYNGTIHTLVENGFFTLSLDFVLNNENQPLSL